MEDCETRPRCLSAEKARVLITAPGKLDTEAALKFCAKSLPVKAYLGVIRAIREWIRD